MVYQPINQERLIGYRVTRLPGYEVTGLPGYEVTGLPGYRVAGWTGQALSLQLFNASLKPGRECIQVARFFVHIILEKYQDWFQLFRRAIARQGGDQV